MIVVAPGWPMMHWFWDLVNLSTKPLLQLPHWPHLLKQPFSHKCHQNLLYLNLHVWHLDTIQNHFNHSLSRWQRELRHLKDPHLEDCMSQGGTFLNSGANRIKFAAQILLSRTYQISSQSKISNLPLLLGTGPLWLIDILARR